VYLQHFGLREAPFALTPDTGYFFPYRHYAGAMNTLLVALRAGEGFIKVVGEVGTGKTLLCRKLLNTLEAGFATAYIPNPYLTPHGLYAAVAEELEVPCQRNMGVHNLIKQLTGRLAEHHRAGRRVVLCIDEAQAMPLETLEALRLLTNLETEKTKLLQVVMFGQPELDTRLDNPAVRQLRQRITFSYALQPMDQDGLAAYVGHRLQVAGYRGPEIFPPRVLRMLYRGSRGIPRLVNILCHKALLAAWGRGALRVSPACMRAAIRDTADARARRRRLHLRLGGSAAAVGLVGAIMAPWLQAGAGGPW